MKKKIVMRNTRQSMTMFKELSEDYLKTCRAKNLSEATIVYYTNCTHMIYKFKDIIYLEEIDTNFIRDYILFLKGTMKPVSINTQLRGIKAILRYGLSIGAIKEMPQITMLTITKDAKGYYTEKELIKLLVKPDMEKTTFAEYRTWVLLNFFLATGQRLSTVSHIKISDINLRSMEWTTRHMKTRDNITLPLSPALCDILQEYIKIREGVEEDYLFCNETGTMLSARGMQSAVERYNKSRGVHKTSIHLMRHTFAKTLILNGADLFSVQRLGNWKDLETVKGYVSMYADDLQKLSSINPLDSFLNQHTKKQIRMK